MNKSDAEIGMKIIIPIYNYKKKLTKIKKGIILYKGNNFATIKTEQGYNESFFYKDIRKEGEKIYYGEWRKM